VTAGAEPGAMGAARSQPLSAERQRCACCTAWPPPVRWAWARQAKGAAAPADEAGSLLSSSSSSSPAAEAHAILEEVLAIEHQCFGPGAGSPDDGLEQKLTVDCMHDEPDVKYYLCSSATSAVVIGYLRLQLPGFFIEEVRRAIVVPEERRMRDSDAEYQVHRQAKPGDPFRQEDFSYALKTPWPFQDREVLQRRWQLPLGEAGGVAIVGRSFEDETVLPQRSDRVRAVAQKAAYLFRPLGADASGAVAAGGPGPGPGLELAICQQLDLGGIVPAWAQRLCSRLAVQRSVEWGAKLKEHCLRMREKEELASATTASADPASVQPPAERSMQERPMTGQQVLDAIFEIERVCCGCGIASSGMPDGDATDATQASDALGASPTRAADAAAAAEAGAKGAAPEGAADPAAVLPESGDCAYKVECLLDEPDVKYCLCSSLESPIVTGYLRVILHDVYPGDVWGALVKKEERLLRAPDSEYQVLREGRPGDPSLEEDVAFVWRAPWPFWDRDVLQRRWTFPLHGSEGLAIVMRSFTDDELLPEREDRVRAFVQKAGYLLRPMNEGFHEMGVELTVCQQVDLGGLCPEWSQEVLTRWAVSRGVQWSEDLRAHCRRRHDEGLAEEHEEEEEGAGLASARSP